MHPQYLSRKRHICIPTKSFFQLGMDSLEVELSLSASLIQIGEIKLEYNRGIWHVTLSNSHFLDEL